MWLLVCVCVFVLWLRLKSGRKSSSSLRVSPRLEYRGAVTLGLPAGSGVASTQKLLESLQTSRELVVLVSHVAIPTLQLVDVFGSFGQNRTLLSHISMSNRRRRGVTWR